MKIAELRAAFADREQPSTTAEVPQKTEAAVAAIFVEAERSEEGELLLIRRAAHPADPWAGDLALPGGRRDPTDTRLVDTAIREVSEEVGLDLPGAGGELLGALPAVQARARGRLLGMSVTPFVFVLPQKPELVVNEEVDVAYFEPVAPLIAGRVDTSRSYLHEGREMKLPAYRVREGILWGLTYQMLRSLFDRVR